MIKKTLLATTAFAAVAASASAVDVEMYGQVNKGVFAIDDGVSSDVSILDNDYSSSRIGFKGAQALDNGLTASVLLEAEIETNASDTATQNTATGASTASASSGSSFAARQARVGLGGDWGAVFIGQQSTATDSVAEQDMAGATDVMDSGLTSIGGGYQFRTTAGALTGTTVSSVYDNFDGGRASSVRYDSPIVNGFQGRVSASQGGDAGAAVYYAGEMDGVMVKAAVGYSVDSDALTGSTTPDEMLMGSVTAKHESGFAGTLAMGKGKKDSGHEPKYTYLKAGYAWDNKEVAVDYANNENTATQELKSVGVGGQYNLGSGVSLGALYRQFELDEAGVDAEEVNVYGVSMRVKF